MNPGERWNESQELRDSATGRPMRRLTTAGLTNSTPSYHCNSTFTADSRYLLILTSRRGRSALLRADVHSGELTCLLAQEGFGDGTRNDTAYWGYGPDGRGGIGHAAMVQGSGWAVGTTPRRVLAAHVETGERRVLVEDLGTERVCIVLCGNASGDKVYLPMCPVHPDLLAGQDPPQRPYDQAMMETFNGTPAQLLELEIDSGNLREVYSDPVAGTAHVVPSPTDDDLVLIDRDLPPTFAYYGDNCQSPRAHILRISTGELTPLRPQNRHQFQSHSNWNHDGSRIYYHGPAHEGHEQPVYKGGRIGEMFLGVSDLSGRSIWEMNFPDYFYGHVSTNYRAEAILTDGMASSDLITAVHYEDLDATGTPRLEVLARHRTDWKALPGQYPHPHPQMSPDGKWLAYNYGSGGRSDVMLVRLG